MIASKIYCMHEQREGEKQVKGTGDIFKSNKLVHQYNNKNINLKFKSTMVKTGALVKKE